MRGVIEEPVTSTRPHRLGFVQRIPMQAIYGYFWYSLGTGIKFCFIFRARRKRAGRSGDEIAKRALTT